MANKEQFKTFKQVLRLGTSGDKKTVTFDVALSGLRILAYRNSGTR